MIDEEMIEEGTGLSVGSLHDKYGIEITDPVAGECALLLREELFSTYDIPFEMPILVSDIIYIIQEEIY